MAGVRGRSGTNRVPTVLRLMHGARPSDVNREEPQPERGAKMPDYLSPGAREQWERVCEQLDVVGVLTVMDEQALAMYCEQFAIWIAAKRAIEEKGVIVMTDAGFPVGNPATILMGKAHDRMLALLKQFGMTPSGRAGIKVDPTRRAPNKFEMIRQIKGEKG